MSAITGTRAAADAASKAKERSEDATAARAQEVPWQLRTALGVLLLGLGFALLYLLVALWPAVVAKTGDAKVTWFGWHMTPSTDSALLVSVVLVSAVGSYVHTAVSFSDFVGNRTLTRSWIWWYMLRVFVGSSLAVVFYFAVRGGFFATDSSSDVNPYGIAAVSGLVGLFSKQATDKLREIFDTAFRTATGYGDDARANSVGNPVPILRNTSPARLAADAREIVLLGSGFTQASLARVAAAGGADAPRHSHFLGAHRLRVDLEPTDVAAPGMLVIAVVNPEPGGGVSQHLSVPVDASVENAPEQHA